MKVVKKFKHKMKQLDDKLQKNQNQIMIDFMSTDNVLHCRECGHRFSIWLMIWKATRVKLGESYNVNCKKCGTVNKIIRGEFSGKTKK